MKYIIILLSLIGIAFLGINYFSGKKTSTINGIAVNVQYTTFKKLDLLGHEILKKSHTEYAWLAHAYAYVQQHQAELYDLCQTPQVTQWSEYKTIEAQRDMYVRDVLQGIVATSNYHIPVQDAAGTVVAYIKISRLRSRLRTFYATQTGKDPWKAGYGQPDMSTIGWDVCTTQHVSNAVYAKLLLRNSIFNTVPHYLLPITTPPMSQVCDTSYVSVSRALPEGLIPLWKYEDCVAIVSSWTRKDLLLIKRAIEKGILWDVQSHLLIDPATQQLWYVDHEQPNNSIGVRPDGTDFFFYQDHPDKAPGDLSYLTGVRKYRHDITTGIGRYERPRGDWDYDEGFVKLLEGNPEQQKVWKEITGIVDNNP